MFYDTELKLLDTELVELKKINGDIQPTDKTIKFEHGVELEVKDRLFCDKDDLITIEGYFSIGETIYKIIDLKAWSDYLDILLYECRRR